MIQETKLTFCEWLKLRHPIGILTYKKESYVPYDIIEIMEPRRTVKIGDLTIREYFENQANYKNLLQKYIKYVDVHEGTDFINNDIYKNESSTFTPKEWETLKQLANETNN